MARITEPIPNKKGGRVTQPLERSTPPLVDTSANPEPIRSHEHMTGNKVALILVPLGFIIMIVVGLLWWTTLDDEGYEEIEPNLIISNDDIYNREWIIDKEKKVSISDDVLTGGKADDAVKVLSFVKERVEKIEVFYIDLDLDGGKELVFIIKNNDWVESSTQYEIKIIYQDSNGSHRTYEVVDANKFESLLNDNILTTPFLIVPLHINKNRFIVSRNSGSQYSQMDYFKWNGKELVLDHGYDTAPND
jgi:hypothetical protein